MSLIEASPQGVRVRIAQSPTLMRVKLGSGSAEVPARELFMGLLAFGCRIKELVSYVAPKEARPELRYGVYGGDIEYEDYEGNEFALFTLNLLKRKQRLTRVVALPLDPRYEPFTSPLIKRFEAIGNGPVFPVNRIAAWAAARNIFDGLGYWIDPYLDFKKNMEIKGHWKPYSDHANRHIRAQELKQFYRFRKDELQSFFRWSARFANVAPHLERYVNDEWQDYANKLLKRRG
jgi:hypothetical protein